MTDDLTKALQKMTQQEKELGEEKESLEIGTLSFKFPITRDEADAVINRPRSQVARKLKKYMYSILKAGAKKMLELKEGEEVKNCKLSVEND